MSSLILNVNYDHFPQPPVDVIVKHFSDADPAIVGHIALENVLAGTNNETKATALSLAPDEETELAEIYSRYKSLTDSRMRPPQMSIFREIYRGYVPFGTIIYNGENDTLRKAPGSETAVAMSNVLLGVSLDTGVAIADLTGTHKGEFSWRNFTKLTHLKRLLVCMRIGQSGNMGVDTSEILASMHPYTTEVQRIANYTNRLTADGHVETTKPGTKGHKHHRPRKSLVSAHRTLREAFKELDENPQQFIDRGDEERERVLAPRVVSYLHKRGYIRSGRGYADGRQPLHDEISGLLKLCKGGRTTQELYDLYGERYKNRTTFAKTLSSIANRLPNSEIRFHPKSGNGTRGKWVYIDPKNGSTKH